MKILYHHRTASKDGQAVHIEEMVHALRQQGHEVRVVAPQPEGGAEMGSQVSWVQRLRGRLPKAAYELLELAYSVVAYRKLAGAVRDFAPDVLYERYNLYLLAGLMLKWRRGIPLLLEVNAPLVEERLRFGGLGLPRLARWVEDCTWQGADVVLPVTQVLAAHVTARGVPVERVVVVPNGINEAHFAGAPANEAAKLAIGWPQALVLGFTGFVRDWHGVDHVVRWLASPVAPAHARLLIVGDGPARPSLEALAVELGLGDRVRFTGVVPRKDVPAWVASFDVALQPAVVPYASPLKLFEYLALGRAIVAPAVPNIREVLDDGENALLFEDGRPGALEEALTRMCNDEALRRRLSMGAAATIHRLGLTWEVGARRVTWLAERLASRPGARQPAVQEPGSP